MIAIKLFLSILPIIIIGMFLYKMDKYKEPNHVLRNIFLVSVGVGLMGGLLSASLDNYLSTIQFNSIFVYNVVKLLFVIALIEEVCKFIPAKLVGMRSKYHSSFYDTLLYFAFSALGFACIENIMYVMKFNVKTALVRGLLSVPGHIIFSLLLGIFIALANKDKQNNNNKSTNKSIIYTTLGFTIASVAHALFNFGLAQTGFFKAIVVCITYLIGIYLLFILKEVGRINNFNVNEIIFKQVLSPKYIKANRKILGIASTMMVILGFLNTFSVYTFVEKYITLKYVIIALQVSLIFIIAYKKKIKEKFKYINITSIIIFMIATKAYVLFIFAYHLNENKGIIDYGNALILLGIIMQFTYYVMDNLKSTQVDVNYNQVNQEVEKNIEETVDNNKFVDTEII